MFERTLEAQALDAGANKLSPFSIAVVVHLSVFAAITIVSMLIVRPIKDPDLPLIIYLPPPPVIEYVRERAAEPAPPAIQRGTERPGATVQPKPEPPKPIEAPTETPRDLPAPADEPPGDPGPGQGLKGDPNGPLDGDPNAIGTTGGPGGPGTNVNVGPIELTPEMVRPVLLTKVQPDYPKVARQARLEGKVTVQAVIGLDGSVESVEIMRSTSSLFEGAALDAVRRWKYRPATMGGQPVRVYFVVEVGFVLR
jgi:periplasmic protein TonB